MEVCPLKCYQRHSWNSQWVICLKVENFMSRLRLLFSGTCHGYEFSSSNIVQRFVFFKCAICSGKFHLFRVQGKTYFSIHFKLLWIKCIRKILTGAIATHNLCVCVCVYLYRVNPLYNFCNLKNENFVFLNHSPWDIDTE